MIALPRASTGQALAIPLALSPGLTPAALFSRPPLSFILKLLVLTFPLSFIFLLEAKYVLPLLYQIGTLKSFPCFLFCFVLDLSSF